MSEFGIVEDTMFIPMVGRIYATEKFPGILYDKKALYNGHFLFITTSIK